MSRATRIVDLVFDAIEPPVFHLFVWPVARGLHPFGWHIIRRSTGCCVVCEERLAPPGKPPP